MPVTSLSVLVQSEINSTHGKVSLSRKEARLPHRRAGVKERDAERREKIWRGGEFPGSQDEADLLSSPQRQDQAERGRAAAAAPRRTVSRREAGRVQPLDAAVGHGQDGLHLLPPLGREHGGYEVAAVSRSREHAWKQQEDAL